MKNQKKNCIIFEVIFEIDNKKEKIKSLQKETNQPGFWEDNDKAQLISKEINEYQNLISLWEKQNSIIEDIEVLIELNDEDPKENLDSEIEEEFENLEKQIENLEFRKMFSNEFDSRNCILTIHPGAGGTESQDWAEMLMRMYLRYCESSGFQTEIMDILNGEEAGIKSVIIEITGEYAYGYLKSEAGVHRLVRISPFDTNKRRHTSFASIFVYPEIDYKIDMEINPTDLKIDTYRASGAGGQHVNKTDSAIRITHIPSGIVAQCQNERSQHKNKANAMKILAARLYKLKLDEQQKEKQKFEDEKKDIAWGSQIRSYVFHPYNMVKDHRTGYETSNTQAVIDGGIQKFISEFLLQQKDN